MRREVEVDTALAELWAEREKALDYIEAQRFSLARAVGIKVQYRGSHRFVAESTPKLIELAEAIVAAGKSIKARDCKTELDRMATYQRKLEAARRAAAPFEEEFEAAPWSRFFWVQAQGGHIHSGMSCSTCFPTTRFAWLPELSGLTEKDAVEAHGAILCTVCFPSAPVEFTGGVSKATQAAFEERAAAKAARDEAKAAKAITAQDGSRLKGEWGTIATLVSAQRELLSALYTLVEWRTELAGHVNFVPVTTRANDAAVRIADAIAFKTGEPVQKVMAEALAKAEKKYKRERG